MSHAKIVIVGSLNMDLVVRTPTLPQPGQTVLGGPFATFPGGKGGNQAVAAARAGGQVTMIGCLGDDPYGTVLRAGLDAEGIDTQAVHTRAATASGVALIEVDPAGQNTIIVAPGANATLGEAEIEQAAASITAADVLLLQLEVPLPPVITAMRLARAHGTRVILNPAPAVPLDESVLALADVLVPNETEAAILSGIEPTDWESAERAGRALQRRGARSVIITLGARGVLLLEDGDAIRQPPFAVQAIDATAAGDAFVGALGAALGEARPLRDALRWGAAAGALATTVAGAQPSLPRRAAIKQLLQSA